MPVTTNWPIEYGCGHRENRDLSVNKGDERAGYATWLTSTDCWHAKHDADNNGMLSKQERLAHTRAEERAAVEQWEHQATMSALSGSEKAVDWGRRCRHELLSAAYEALVVNGDMPEGQYVEMIARPARLIDRACWWIDNRHAESDDVRELVEAAQTTSAVATENDL